jgi:hypothetical protein
MPLFLIMLFLIAGNTEIFSQRLSRDLNVDLLVNHAGYLPDAAKTCVTRGVEKRNFTVIDIITGQVVY